VKIAFVVHDYRRREGHSRYVVELATRFSQRHEVHVFADQIETDGDSKIHFHHVPAWRSTALIGILSFAFSATMRVRGNFDIIHNQGLCGIRGNVFTAHICNRAWHQALREITGRLSLREWISGTMLSALEHLFYRCARKCQVIGVSRRVENDIRKYYRSTAPITVVYHGVDLVGFSPARQNPLRGEVRAECGLDEGEMAFLFVGDLRKGGRQCLEALSKLDSGKLLLVSRSATEPYRELAAQLGISKRVVFLGPTGEVQRYYAASDALLLPSHYDSFALVVTEAMASELPVIISPEAGSSELINNGVNGLLLKDFRDATELSDKMHLLMDDPTFAARLGMAARHTVEEHSWDIAAAETMRVYERQLSESPVSSVNDEGLPGLESRKKLPPGASAE
jgi:UDP-glucose:(heptosyl)LPS alpha-1,3-glucosyltransferase